MQLLSLDLQKNTKKTILEKIDYYLEKPGPMRHIVSINPENLVVAQQDKGFRLILQSGDVKLNDGIGIVLASILKGEKGIERYTGVDFMDDVIGHIQNRRLRVLLLGGSPNLAKELAECYQKKYPNVRFFGVNGIKSIKDYQEEDEGSLIIKEIAAIKPHFIFAAFGSPFQEKWFWNHRDQLQGIICAGVGGGFDFLSGRVQRAPKWVRKIGFEWLFRLLLQPWRLLRQLRLLKFMWYVLTK